MSNPQVVNSAPVAPQHYVYERPDQRSLYQGDILKKTSELSDIIRGVYPYFVDKEDYKFYMILSQTCDIFSRNGEIKSPYIEICVVRPLRSVLEREAKKYQTSWQTEMKVIGENNSIAFGMFIQRLIDNNEKNYFYLHEEQLYEFPGNHCAFLPVSVTLKSTHYQACLNAKILQLKGEFQAKLGYILGNLYSRIGTSEWNDFNPTNKADKMASSLIGSHFEVVSDSKIKEAFAQFSQGAPSDSETIYQAVKRAKNIPLSTKFKNAVDKLVRETGKPNILDWNSSAICGKLRADDAFKRELHGLISGSEPIEEKIEKICTLVKSKIPTWAAKQDLEANRQLVEKFILALMGDAGVRSAFKE